MQKGHSNNPSGRPALPWDVLQAKRNLRASYDRVVCKLLSMKLKEIDDVVRDVDAPVVTRILAKIIQRQVTDPDIDDLETLFGRTLGKPSSDLDMIARETTDLAKQMIDMPDADKIKLIEARLQELKESQ